MCPHARIIAGRRLLFIAFGAAVAVVVASACGGGEVSDNNPSDASVNDASRSDGARDATSGDSSTSTDSGFDSGKIDAGYDSGNDSGGDSGVDASLDASLDADAAPPLSTGCSGSTDPHWGKVTAYIPCTVDF